MAPQNRQNREKCRPHGNGEKCDRADAHEQPRVGRGESAYGHASPKAAATAVAKAPSVAGVKSSAARRMKCAPSASSGRKLVAQSAGNPASASTNSPETKAEASATASGV